MQNWEKKIHKQNPFCLPSIPPSPKSKREREKIILGDTKITYAKYLFSQDVRRKKVKSLQLENRNPLQWGLSGERTENVCEKSILGVCGVQMFGGTWLALTEQFQPQPGA